ncbi:MAG TPA: hypothetical protein VGN11_11275, partial [Candidatus Baltobacteraceae bacterium]|nr:hypothetical protein [Candidatus Baltobacteraceae bacterium]
HPQSIVHGFVVFTDGSIKAQLCAPDMKVPIGYALAYPNRLSPLRQAQGDGNQRHQSGIPSLSKDALSALGANPQAVGLRYDFDRPDFERFPCLRLAYEALERGGVAPAVLSAANEVAVRAFVEEKIAFGAIAQVVEAAMHRVTQRELTLDAVRTADAEARIAATEFLGDYLCC